MRHSASMSKPISCPVLHYCNYFHAIVPPCSVSLFWFSFLKAKYYNNDIAAYLSKLFTRLCWYANVEMGAALTAGYHSLWLRSISPSGSAFHNDICQYNKTPHGVNITGRIDRRTLTGVIESVFLQMGAFNFILWSNVCAMLSTGTKLLE